MKTLSTIQKEFDERWNTCKWSEKDGRHPESFLIRGAEEGEEDRYDDDAIKQFLTTSLKQLLEQVIPEKQEGYTLEGDRYEVCRQQVEDRIRKILNN